MEPLRAGVSFPHRHSHEAVHLQPLMDRLRDMLVAPPEPAAVVVQADTRPPAPEAWNVQIFHGLGDKAYVGNPLFLQKGRMPRLRTALNRPLSALRLPAPFLQPPARPGRKASRYQQVNAYGRRLADALETFLRGAEITRFGHVALNEREGISSDPDGPLLWLPTWDNRAFLGGPQQSSLDAFAAEVAKLPEAGIPAMVKYHPHTVGHNQARKARRLLEKTAGITIVPPERGAYDLLQGCRAVLTDTSSLGFEAYCAGIPVSVAKPTPYRSRGLHAELEQRVVVHSPARPTLRAWAEAPEHPADHAWARDLMEEPSAKRNDLFAAQLRQAVLERKTGRAW